MPNKTTLPQRNLLIAQLERLFRRVRKAISDINMNNKIANSETEMKKTLSNLEDATTYLVDHPTEQATAEDLINRFTDIQDEHDDFMDEFRQMLQENTAETTPQQQNTNATTVQVPQKADSVQQQTILDRDSSQTSILSNSSHQPGSSIQQTAEDQNFSDSRDTHQQVPQTGFEIDRPPLQQTEHDTTKANLSFNIVTEQQFIPAAVSQTSSNGQSRANYSLMTRPPKVKMEPCDGNPMKWSMCFGLFEATIHNQATSDIEKMTHLQTLLSGKANQAFLATPAIALCTTLPSTNYDDDMDDPTSSSMTSSTDYRASSNHQLIAGIRTWNFPHSSVT